MTDTPRQPANGGPVVTQAQLAERITQIPGIERLLSHAAELAPLYLVGGAVRDLLLGSAAVDLDLCVEADAVAQARKLARLLGGSCVAHNRFGTATVTAPGLELDLATARRERYKHPGALPTVEPATLVEDLDRRDFSINAMALGLSGEELGKLYDPHAGRSDLEAGVVRVLYERSFIDDPTRLLRAVRYECRLCFAMDSATERLARQAAGVEALRWVSGSRLREALVGLLTERRARFCLARLHELSLDRAMHPSLSIDPGFVSACIEAAPDVGADSVLSALAGLVCGASQALDDFVERLELGASGRDRVTSAARLGPGLASRLSGTLSGSQLYEALEQKPAEALALAVAAGAPIETVLRYLRELRPVRLEISGEDMIRAGIPESPVIGQALAETFKRKLDGELSGRCQELEFALACARGRT